MAWTDPEYSPQEVNAAARKLAQMTFPNLTLDSIRALVVINNWRASHAYPLNTFQNTLRHKAKKIEDEIIVAQRIKRLDSIHRKLASQPTMRMSQMQDIAGCRVVFKNNKSIDLLVNNYKSSRSGHKIKGEKDYISNPKLDGYRSYYIIFEYRGTYATRQYDGLRVEVQIRTQLQHAWATAVEAVGIFTNQALKSNQGSQDWLRFFALMGTAIAAMESCNSVPGTPTKKSELIREIINLSVKLNIDQILNIYNTTIITIGSAKDAKYFLLQLDLNQSKVLVRRFKARESAEANRQYTKYESEVQDGSNTQVVLVSVENINALKRAYPNYFLDTKTFAQLVEKVRNSEFPDPIAH